MTNPSNQGYNPATMASEFLKLGCVQKVTVGDETCEKRLLQWYHGNFYLWRKRIYGLLTKDEITAEVTRYIQGTPIKPTPNCVNAVLLNLKALTELNRETQPNSWINNVKGPRVWAVENGNISFDDADENGRPKLLPHTPDYFTLVKLPFEYAPEAECPNWLKFLDDVMESDSERIRLLQQWVGYLFTLTLKEQKFLICVGEGANGKGVFFIVILEMLGQENCSSLPLSRFGERFALSSTYGKLLNATSEGISYINTHGEAVLKEYTSGDMTAFERKHKDLFHAIPTAKLMIATNELPSFADKTEGVWRRMLIVPFERSFTEDQQNKNLAEELKEELPGIFNWAYDGMVNLEKKGFVVPAKCKEAIEQYRRDVNPAKVFLQENYQQDTEADGVPCGILYSSYCDWCKAKGYKPLNEANLGKEIKRVFPKVPKTRPRNKETRKRTHVYANLEVQDDAEINDPNFDYQYSRA